MTPDEFKKVLFDKGYGISEDRLASRHNNIKWYAWKSRIKVRNQCETNDKPQQIIITPHQFNWPDGNNYTSASCNVTGELGGRWFKLDCYSLPFEQVVNEIDQIQADLIAAWEAIGDSVKARSMAEAAKGEGP